MKKHKGWIVIALAIGAGCSQAPKLSLTPQPLDSGDHAVCQIVVLEEQGEYRAYFEGEPAVLLEGSSYAFTASVDVACHEHVETKGDLGFGGSSVRCVSADPPVPVTVDGSAGVTIESTIESRVSLGSKTPESYGGAIIGLAQSGTTQLRATVDGSEAVLDVAVEPTDELLLAPLLPHGRAPDGIAALPNTTLQIDVIARSSGATRCGRPPVLVEVANATLQETLTHANAPLVMVVPASGVATISAAVGGVDATLDVPIVDASDVDRFEVTRDGRALRVAAFAGARRVLGASWRIEVTTPGVSASFGSESDTAFLGGSLTSDAAPVEIVVSIEGSTMTRRLEI